MGLKFAIILAGLIAITTALPKNIGHGDGLRLIKTSQADPGRWLSQEQVFDLIKKEVGFMDITNHQSEPIRKHKARAFPETPQHQSIVEDIIPAISSARMESFIQTFSEFNNRYYSASTGAQSSQWLQSQVEAVLESSGYSATQVTVQPFEHSWLQNSVIARIEGSDPELKSEIIVLGGHQDSVNLLNPSNGRAPGADDDASGSSVLLETFNVLLNSGFVPKRTVEFQWYAAEEVGLWGSQDIAEAYANDDVNVIAMANFDVVGFIGPNSNREMGIITDNTDSGLNDFIRSLIEEYCISTWKNLTCGYSCSDHASWDRYGFAATFPVEYDDNPNMHTIRDTIDTVDFEYTKEFVKLATGFIVELSEQGVSK